MRDALAERLLAEVMQWTPEDIARERPVLQAMATYKYDEYQQFSPGMRFVESLALWLDQFSSPSERGDAYDFIMKCLVFLSVPEINHLVSISYPDVIRPHLLRSVAREAGFESWRVGKVARSAGFRLRQRQCLFLGLSDGARTDVFRRSNSELSHEQIFQTYEITEDRVNALLGQLRAHSEPIPGPSGQDNEPKFRTVVLLDDFSGSGYSYLRKESDGSFGGKIAKFLRSITDANSDVSRLVDATVLEVLIVLYVATEESRRRLETLAQEMNAARGVKLSVYVVHPLRTEIGLRQGGPEPIHRLIGKYYTSADNLIVHDEHMRKGGTSDARYGFSACGLPLVLSHNTPNNSIYLLWSYEGMGVRGLFPRVRRHKEAV